MKDRFLYESFTTGPPPIFSLELSDNKFVESIIDRLGPGGIID